MMKTMIGVGEGPMVTVTAPRVRLMSKVVTVGSVQLKVFSIGHLALAIMRSPATIRRWQRDKIIPPPIINAGDSTRWYLKEELETYRRVVTAYGMKTGVNIATSGFPEEMAAEIRTLKERLTKTVNQKKVEGKK